MHIHNILLINTYIGFVCLASCIQLKGLGRIIVKILEKNANAW